MEVKPTIKDWKSFLNRFYPNFQLNIDVIFNKYLNVITNITDDEIKEKIKKDIDDIDKEIVDDYKIFIITSITTKEKSLSISKNLLEIRKELIRECSEILKLDVSLTEKIIDFGDNYNVYTRKWILDYSVELMKECNS